MVYYIFKSEDANEPFIKYGYVPADKIAAEDLESIKENAFAIVEDLPPIPNGTGSGRFFLDYNEKTEKFFWVETE
jgi:hypothetical protein